MCGFISGLSILFCWFISSVFVPIQHCFDYCSFAVLSEVWEYYLKSGRVMPPGLFSFLKIAFAVLSLLWFHINFWMISSSFVKNVMSWAVLGITNKIEARPQTPLLILQAWSRDEGVRSCDSDLFFPFLCWLERMLRCLLFLREAWESTKPSAVVPRK